MKQTNILAFGFLAIAFSSCQVKLAEVTPASEITVTAASILGVWSTDCIEDSSDSYIKSFEVKDDVLTMATLHYGDTRICDQTKLTHTIMSSGSLTISGDNTAIANAKNYELKLSAVVVVPNDPAVTTMLNNGNVCGSSSWVTNQAGFLFSCNAGQGYNYSQVSFNTVHYGVFKIEATTTPNYLQFEAACAVAGNQDFCPSASDRPATLSGTVYYKR